MFFLWILGFARMIDARLFQQELFTKQVASLLHGAGGTPAPLRRVWLYSIDLSTLCV